MKSFKICNAVFWNNSIYISWLFIEKLNYKIYIYYVYFCPILK